MPVVNTLQNSEAKRVRAPERPSRAVREKLAEPGRHVRKLPITCDSPCPNSSWSGRIRSWMRRSVPFAIMTDSNSESSASASAPGSNASACANDSAGSCGTGSPCGRVPTSASSPCVKSNSATISAPDTTASSAPGTNGEILRPTATKANASAPRLMQRRSAAGSCAATRCSAPSAAGKVGG